MISRRAASTSASDMPLGRYSSMISSSRVSVSTRSCRPPRAYCSMESRRCLTARRRTASNSSAVRSRWTWIFSFFMAASMSRSVATRGLSPAFIAAFRSASMRACIAEERLSPGREAGNGVTLRTVRRFLIGTAGHIDHGKTSLVKALTGIDADRLPEEKRRGITIDLGFAHAEWDGIRMSFVDVPGHERFVRNMLAGAGGIQAVLFVVAADESVMPQTREHFEIVRLLGLSSGIVAVTKTDRVAPELVEVTASDVRDLVRGSFLEGAPIVPVSARTGEGLETLKAELVRVAQQPRPAARSASPRAEEIVRLPIDRAFLVAGFGPVVTGSLVSGRVRKDDRLEVLPDRRPVRVRRLEVHGREVEEACAGERVSANLAGAELSDLRRGLFLATPDALATSTRLVARMELLPGSPRLRSGDRVSFHPF